MDGFNHYKNTVLQGDCFEVLKTLPNESIECCVTSPPYYGLRDYGTGKWVGGDEKCPHKRMSKQSKYTITGHAQSELIGNVGDAIYKTICPLCGAKREDKQIGLEETPNEYIEKLVSVFREVRRVLKDDGTLWVNIGDSYNGNKKGNTEINKHQGVVTDTFEKKLWVGAKEKDLIGIPWMLAFALRDDGWYLRQDIIWHKPNPMPESVKDRCTKSHEYIFLLSKSPRYYFDYKAIQEEAKQNIGDNADIRLGGNKYGDNMHERRALGFKDEQYMVRNKRDVWTVPTKPDKEAHFATFPQELIKPCILAGCRRDGIVLDPFFGSGTTGRVAQSLNRNYLGIELNPSYIEISDRVNNNVQLSLEGFL